MNQGGLAKNMENASAFFLVHLTSGDSESAPVRLWAPPRAAEKHAPRLLRCAENAMLSQGECS